MNLAKLFEMQKALDERIIREKRLEGKDLLPMKILALQVELGELANEWRGFKFWSNNQSPTQPKHNWKPSEDGQELRWDPKDGYESHPLLEEYVDCLHFILSIGLEIGENPVITEQYLEPFVGDMIADQFNAILKSSCEIDVDTNRDSEELNGETWSSMLNYFVGLGIMLGFTWDEIEASYLEKNRTNHARQDSGY